MESNSPCTSQEAVQSFGQPTNGFAILFKPQEVRYTVCKFCNAKLLLHEPIIIGPMWVLALVLFPDRDIEIIIGLCKSILS